MGQKYLIDSNIIIDYTALRIPQTGSDFVEELFNTDFQISVVVKIEVLGFNDIGNKLTLMEEFINTATILSLNDEITQQTISLRRKYKKLKLGDAIIGATALVHNLILVSRNAKDFENIKGLKLLNPHSL